MISPILQMKKIEAHVTCPKSHSCVLYGVRIQIQVVWIQSLCHWDSKRLSDLAKVTQPRVCTAGMRAQERLIPQPNSCFPPEVTHAIPAPNLECTRDGHSTLVSETPCQLFCSFYRWPWINYFLPVDPKLWLELKISHPLAYRNSSLQRMHAIKYTSN